MIWPWVLFLVLILVLLALDLGVFHRQSREISFGEALAWTCFWVVLALSFNVGIYFLYEHHLFGVGKEIGHELSGEKAALQFFIGYLLEKSLSLDNIFVIALIFTYFRVPLKYQHRVLFWGVLGAVVLRGLMIALGVVLIRRFDWIVYVFGGFLILTAVKMLILRHDNLQPNHNPAVRLARRLFVITPDFEKDKFFSRVGGKRAVTPLFLALILVESSDILFAVDSIPAIFAITRDPFLIYTSNIFAILGLRSLYFALAAVMEKFRYLKMSLTFLLAFIGVKMILTHHHPISNQVSLAVIAGILMVGILASIVGGRRDTAALASPLADGMEALAITTYRGARRVAVLVIGSTVLLVGIAMVVLPGPAVLVIPAGLALLASEFAWARWLLRKTKKQIHALSQTVLGNKERKGD